MSYGPIGPDGYSQPDGLPPDYYGGGEVQYDPRTMAGYDLDRLYRDQQIADALWRRMQDDQRAAEAAAAMGVTEPTALRPWSEQPQRYTSFADRLREHIRQRGDFTLLDLSSIHTTGRISEPVRHTLTDKEQAERRAAADAYRASFDNPDCSTIAQGLPLNLYMHPQDVDFCNDFLDFMEQVGPVASQHQRHGFQFNVSQLRISRQPSRDFLRDPRGSLLFRPTVKKVAADGATTDTPVSIAASYRRFIDTIPTGELDDRRYMHAKIGAYSLKLLYDERSLQGLAKNTGTDATLWLCADRLIRATVGSNWSNYCLPPPAIEGDLWPTISLAPTINLLPGNIATTPEQKLLEAAYEAIR